MIYTTNYVKRKYPFPCSCVTEWFPQMPTPRKLIDLTHAVAHGLITYKGLPAPVICDYLSREASRKHYAPGTGLSRLSSRLRTNSGVLNEREGHEFTRAVKALEMRPRFSA